MEVMLKEVVVSFPEVFKATAFKAGDSKYFSVQIPIAPDSANHKAIKKAIKQAAADKWEDKADAVLAKLVKDDRVFYHEEEKQTQDGDTVTGFEDQYWLRASRPEKDGPPSVFDRKRQEIVESDGKIYSGAVCNVLIDVWAQDGEFGRRINGKLLGVQFVRDGEALGGSSRKASADKFEVYAEEEEDANDLA